MLYGYPFQGLCALPDPPWPSLRSLLLDGVGTLPVPVLMFSHLSIPDHQELVNFEALEWQCEKNRKSGGGGEGEGRKTKAKKRSLSGSVCLSVLRGPSRRKQEKRTRGWGTPAFESLLLQFSYFERLSSKSDFSFLCVHKPKKSSLHVYGLLAL